LPDCLIAIGPSAVVVCGAFVGPLTVPHLSVNTLTGSRAIIGRCLIAIFCVAVCNFKLQSEYFRLIGIIFSFSSESVKADGQE
jgi:hypothetical protein